MAARPASEKAPTVAITGARGEMGRILREQFSRRGYRVVAIVRATLPIVEDGKAGPNELDFVAECRAGDLTNAEAVKGLLDGCDAIVHLAALPKPWEPYEKVYANNFVVDYNMLAEAQRAGCKRFVYASTNHVDHGKSMRSTPETLDSTAFGMHLPEPRVTKLTDAPDPDSYYAVSKLNCENLGRLFAREHGLEYIGARIGWIVPEDDPRKSKWVESDDNKEYMRAMWLSHRDCDEIFSRCVTMELPESARHGRGHFALLYACSNNSRRVFDLESTAALLGHAAQDDVEKLVAEDWAHIGYKAAA